MNPSTQSFNLPQSDGTSSTDYGTDFRIYNIALFVLRFCKHNLNFDLWFNHDPRNPWNDVVIIIDNVCLCVQMRLNWEKITLDLQKRSNVMETYSNIKKSIFFVYSTTASDERISTISEFNQTSSIPSQVKLITTNHNAVYKDSEESDVPTYLAARQSNSVQLELDITNALKDLIGENLIPEDDLNDVKLKFIDYVRWRYKRLIKKGERMTKQEIELQLSAAILENQKVQYDSSDTKLSISNNLFTKLFHPLTPIIVINHRTNSLLRKSIWNHLKYYYGQIKELTKTHIRQNNLQQLWLNGEFYMPVVSGDANTDKVIFRALQISNFRLNVLVMRKRPFSIKSGNSAITLLESLPIEECIEVRTNEVAEIFKIAHIGKEVLLEGTKDISVLHEDLFSRIVKDYLTNDDGINHIVEAHDERAFVNDFILLGQIKMPALFAAIKIKDVKLDIIRQIIDLGANVNACIDEDLTPIYYAVQQGRLDILKLLLENGADPNVSTKTGVKVLYMAIDLNNLDMIKYLIEYGAIRSDCDRYGVSPLFMAYNNKNYEVMKLILKNFDRAHWANTTGSHIVHIAAEENNLDCLKCVVDNYHDIEVFINGDAKGKNPLNIASERNHKEFFEILSNARVVNKNRKTLL